MPETTLIEIKLYMKRVTFLTTKLGLKEEREKSMEDVECSELRGGNVLVGLKRNVAKMCASGE